MNRIIKQQKKSPLIQMMVFVSLIVLIILAILMLSENKLEDENQFDLRLDAYNKIAAERIDYEMIHAIPVTGERLYAVTLDTHDFIYASTDAKIIKFNRFGSEITSFNTPEAIRALRTHEGGDIFAAGATRIYRFNADGSQDKLLITLSDSSLVTSIDVRGDDIFIADAGNRIVAHYDTSGSFIQVLGGPAQGRAGFIIPSPFFDLALDADSSLWVVNPGEHNFEKYNFQGELTQSWGKHSPEIEGFCGCCNPSHFAIIPNRGFVTSEKGLVRIKIYDQAGTLISIVAGPDQFPKQAKDLDLVVDSEGRIIVADPASKALKIFVPKQGD